jgi:hypothetical protein
MAGMIDRGERNGKPALGAVGRGSLTAGLRSLYSAVKDLGGVCRAVSRAAVLFQLQSQLFQQVRFGARPRRNRTGVGLRQI